MEVGSRRVDRSCRDDERVVPGRECTTVVEESVPALSIGSDGAATLGDQCVDGLARCIVDDDAHAGDLGEVIRDTELVTAGRERARAGIEVSDLGPHPEVLRSLSFRDEYLAEPSPDRDASRLIELAWTGAVAAERADVSEVAVELVDGGGARVCRVHAPVVVDGEIVEMRRGRWPLARLDDVLE